MAPSFVYFSFSRDIEDTRQWQPQAGQGPATRAAEEMGNVTAKNFKHRGFSLKQERGNVMFNI